MTDPRRNTRSGAITQRLDLSLWPPLFFAIVFFALARTGHAALGPWGSGLAILVGLAFLATAILRGVVRRRVRSGDHEP